MTELEFAKTLYDLYSSELSEKYNISIEEMDKINEDYLLFDYIYYYQGVLSKKPMDKALEMIENELEYNGFVFENGYEDFISAYIDKISEKEKYGNRRRQNKNYKKHLKFLSDTIGGYNCSAYYYDYSWKDKTRKPYYKRLYRGKRSKYIKKDCNRRIRRNKEVLLQRGMKNRYTEFWWNYD